MKRLYPEKYQGFDLSQVCWGYRDLFINTIDHLFEQGLIGDERKEVTSRFFDVLQRSEQRLFDHVLKEFLQALANETAWILDIPALFEDITEMGMRFAESKLYYGVSYFKILGQGGFGKTPEQVHHLINWLKRLLIIDEALALSLLKGYQSLINRLNPDELDRYVQEGISCYEVNPQTGQHFLEGILKSCEASIKHLTRECRLHDVDAQLEKLLLALTGQQITVDHLGCLDSDELLERNTRIVCMYKWLYLPRRIKFFESRAMNRKWYFLQTIVGAGMLSCNSFSYIHGHPDYETAADLIGDSLLTQNLFQIIEYTRVLTTIQQRWPGSKALINFGLQTECAQQSPLPSGPEQLFFDVFDTRKNHTESVRLIREIAELSQHAFDTADRLHQISRDILLKAYPGLGSYLLRTFAFLPDFFYPGSVSTPPADKRIFDLKNSKKSQKTSSEREDSDHAPSRFDPDASTVQSSQEEDRDKEFAPACYVYDEWSQEENDYYPNYCFVYEKTAPFIRQKQMLPDVFSEGNKVRRIFELLKPDEASKEKRLPEGDYINEDLLIEYLVALKQEPSPKVEFFEKLSMRKRDIAVLLLLDVSGSTGELVADKKVIDIEKHAALVLGQGLSVLGDRFEICGFSGTGRERCEFIIFKHFDDVWDNRSMSRVLSAWPVSSTRMGAALRHAGYRLHDVDARQKLLMMISDGKPLDKEYSPQTRYAQHDVRMACLENRRQGIVTFCISTLENSRSDMELMFPDKRFVILNSIQQLTQILPRCYMKLTL